jgi:hypothetical protein
MVCCKEKDYKHTPSFEVSNYQEKKGGDNMAEIKLTKEQLVKLAGIGKIIHEKGVPAAEAGLKKLGSEFQLPPEFKTREVTCNTCAYCSACGTTPVAWVGVDLIVNVAGW